MKIRITLFIFSLILVNWSLIGQVHHEWSFGIGSKKSEGQGPSYADHAGNIYSLLQMKDTVDIDPGPGTEIIVPEKDLCLILTKNDEDGNLVFGYPFEIDANSYGAIMEVAQNQIRLSIGFRDSLIYKFNGHREKLFSQAGKNNAIVTLDLDGKITDSYSFPSPEEFYFTSFYTLPDGRILMAGTFSDTLALSAQSPFTLYCSGDADGFILLADQNFNPLWARQFKGTGYDYMNSMFVLNNERIYFTASFDDTLSLATLQGPITQVSAGGEDPVFGYMNLSGDIEKAFFIHGTGYDDASDIASDAAGNIYIGGTFENTVNFASASQPPQSATAANESDGYVAKYDAIGNLVWLGIFPSGDYGGVLTLDLKRGNELYISGIFTLTADLDPGPDSLIVHTGYHSSPFISKISTNGDFIWAIPFITNEVAGIRALMILTETSRVVANGFYYDSLHCSEMPGENWLHTDYGADCFLFSLTEENVVTAFQEIANKTVDDDVLLYPNPAVDNITVKSESIIGHISLQSADGKMIGSFQPSENHELEINLAGLPAGIYFLTVINGKQSTTRKIIKQ